MTTRERLEHRAERRRAWAKSRARRAEAASTRAHTISSAIPFGQPILVGHHSERHHRRDLARIDSAMGQAVESSNMAAHHTSCAAGIEDQLERSVFSDDTDAIEALEARIAEREAEAEKHGAINRAWRKSKGDLAALAASGLVSPKLAETIAQTMKVCPWLRVPLDTTNLRANIRRDRERIEDIRRRQARTERAEAGGGIVIEGDTWVRVTFAEKPERATLETLKAAGFRWGGGSWAGERAKLPASVAALAATGMEG